MFSRKGAGVAAVRTELTRELMLPVIEAEAAADCMAMAKAGRIEGGILAAISCWAAEERAGGEVLGLVSLIERGKEMKTAKRTDSVEPLKEGWAWRGARLGVAFVRRARRRRRRRGRIFDGGRMNSQCLS